MMIEVIEPFWHEFITKIKDVSSENLCAEIHRTKKKIILQKIENVDAVLTAHGNFLDNCVRNCFISDPILLLGVTQLCQICLKFCGFLQVCRFIWKISQVMRNSF